MKKLLEKLMAKPSTDILMATSYWLSSLNNLDEYTALKRVTKHLEETLIKQTLKIQDRMTQLEMIDEYCHPMIAKLAFQFVKYQHLRQELEVNISETAYAYYRQIYLWHLKLIETYATKKNDVDYNTSRALFGRTIEIVFNMIRWRSYTQASVPANIWPQLYKIFTIASEKNLLTTPVQLAENEAPATIGALIIRSVMLGSMDNSKLTRQQVDITAMLLKKWLISVQISESFNPEKHSFYFDLYSDSGAKRTRNITPEKSNRYWELIYLETKLSLAIAGFEQQELPDDITPSNFFNDYQSFIDTLEILKEQWSAVAQERQRRKESRSLITIDATICYGIEETCRQIRKINMQQSFDEENNHKEIGRLDDMLMRRSSPQNTILGISNQAQTYISGNHWSITDKSNKGIGAYASKDQNLWVTPGKIVGMLLENESNILQIGTVRNIRPSKMNEVKIGVEIISKKASTVQMVRKLEVDENSETPNITGASGLLSFLAIFIPAEENDFEEPTLIIPKANFEPYKDYEVSTLKNKRTIHIGSPIDTKDDWVMVTYPSET